MNIVNELQGNFPLSFSEGQLFYLMHAELSIIKELKKYTNLSMKETRFMLSE